MAELQEAGFSDLATAEAHDGCDVVNLNPGMALVVHDSLNNVMFVGCFPSWECLTVSPSLIGAFPLKVSHFW